MPSQQVRIPNFRVGEATAGPVRVGETALAPEATRLWGADTSGRPRRKRLGAPCAGAAPAAGSGHGQGSVVRGNRSCGAAGNGYRAADVGGAKHNPDTESAHRFDRIL